MRRFYYEDAEKPWEPDGILKKQVPRLAVLARDDKPRALDVGMGYGRNAIWLAEQGYEVEGWEREGRYVREAKQEAKRRGVRLTVRRGDFTKAKVHGPYDVIVISQALHQVKRSAALRVLRRVAPLLRPPLRLRSGQAGFEGQAGGKLFLLVKLPSDRHVQRARRDPAWKAVRGEKNTWLRPGVLRLAVRGLRIKPRTPQMILSALEPGEIRQALKGLRVRHWRTVVLRSDWEDDWRVTHTVAEVVAERV